MAPTSLPNCDVSSTSTFKAYAAGVTDGKVDPTDLLELGTSHSVYEAEKSIYANMRDHGFTDLYGIDCDSDSKTCDCYHNDRHLFLGSTTVEEVLANTDPAWRQYTLVTFLVSNTE